ncbi:MAG: DUF4238 domain-containing protein [Clostridia bacterium]|nr:DUF4238 domain-containing protein [Clostridia bacterium]
MRTQKEHYIPQVYLKGFTNDENNIWFYDFEKKFSPNKPVPTKSVCYEEYLYEIRNDNGDIIFDNYLEQCLSVLERMFSKYRTKIKNKTFLENQKTNCFLSRDEKIFWVTYITLQILREPRLIKATEKVCSHFYSKITTENTIKNISRMLCLPLFEEINEDSPFMYLFNSLLDGMLNLGFVVVIDQSDLFITSDFPVCIFSASGNITEVDRVIFPISSNTCLFLINKEEQKEYGKNKLFFIDKETRDEINLQVACNANQKIFFKKKLSDKEICLYKKERDKYKRPSLDDIAF